jgi:hypothetical protein
MDDAASVELLRPFDWERGFPWLAHTKGFDVIVANPPYVRPHNIAPEYKRLLWKSYETFVKKSDLYCCFIERSIQLVRRKGTVAMITPRTWTSSDSFLKLRQFITRRSQVRSLTRLPKRVFKKAAVETFVFSLDRTHPESPDLRMPVVREALAPDGTRREERRFPMGDILRAHGLNFLLESQEVVEDVIGRMLATSDPLGLFVDFQYGFKTADDAKFLSATRDYPESVPYVTSGDIERYYCAPPRGFVRFDPARMRANKATARPGERARFEASKIIVSRMGNRELACYYDAGGMYVKDAMLLLAKSERPSLAFLTAVLNSSPVRLAYRTRFVTIDVMKSALLQLPVPRPGPHWGDVVELHTSVSRQVCEMQSSMARLRVARSDAERAILMRRIAALDSRIDGLVARCFNLSEATLAEIQSALAAGP